MSLDTGCVVVLVGAAAVGGGAYAFKQRQLRKAEKDVEKKRQATKAAEAARQRLVQEMTQLQQKDSTLVSTLCLRSAHQY